MSDYNGWTNYETWLVNVTYDPQTVADVHMAREIIEENIEAIDNCFISSLLSVTSINWQELEDAMVEDE